MEDFDLGEFDELCKHGFYLEAFYWANENFSFGTPNYYFYRAFACAYLEWSEEVDFPVGISWGEEATLSLDVFLDIVKSDILEAIGWGLLAEIEYNAGDYAGALRSMSLALICAGDDTDIVQKADELMWKIGGRLSENDSLPIDLIEDDFEDRVDADEYLYYPDTEDVYEDDIDFDPERYPLGCPGWYEENAINVLVQVGKDSFHEN